MDAKGFKVVDTIAAEALAKFVGFQPKSVSEVQEATSFALRSNAFYAQNSSEIRAQWAKALYEKGDAAVQRVRDRLESWKAGTRRTQTNPSWCVCPTCGSGCAKWTKTGASALQTPPPKPCAPRSKRI